MIPVIYEGEKDGRKGIWAKEESGSYGLFMAEDSGEAKTSDYLLRDSYDAPAGSKFLSIATIEDCLMLGRFSPEVQDSVYKYLQDSGNVFDTSEGTYTSVAIGRWQGLHSEHEKLLKSMCEKSDYVIICLGSSDICNGENPFNFKTGNGEYAAVEIIRAALEGYENYSIVMLEDVPSDEVWMRNAYSAITTELMRQGLRPDIGWTVTGNASLVEMLQGSKKYDFGEFVHPFEIKSPPYEDISGTEIRKSIALGTEYHKNHMSKKVLETINNLGVDERLRREYNMADILECDSTITSTEQHHKAKIRADIAKLYALSMRPGQYDETSWSTTEDNDSPFRRLIWESIEEVIRSCMEGRTEEGLKLLDIGAGTNWLPERMRKKYGLLAQGIEISKNNVNYARENRPDSPIIQGDFLVHLFQEKYSMMTSVMADPNMPLDSFFKRAHFYLEINGQLIMVVPDMDYFTREEKLERCRIEYREHEVILHDSGTFQGERTDIIRPLERYLAVGSESGFRLSAHSEIRPTEEFISALKDGLPDRFRDRPLMHVLVFDKI